MSELSSDAPEAPEQIFCAVENQNQQCHFVSFEAFYSLEKHIILFTNLQVKSM
jgi:hypothetical protein